MATTKLTDELKEELMKRPMADRLRFLATLFPNFKDTTCPATGQPCIRGCFDRMTYEGLSCG